ncbi:Putative amidohydrolase 2 [Sodalis praecaptivus]|uniref:Putative amidohydrolase 2 n=2 Tax=Sodalis TaxID=84565 RepID=W0I1U0_9GAMM|nr:amidohydrolase family protein [Sodalis praecaptivus]AHF78757.1 Putative amidohydrolase 2 [Sodalis praecaptivus]
MLHITDTHLHLWDLSRFRLPWLEAVPALQHDVAWQDYPTGDRNGRWRIDRALYVEVDVAPDQRQQEADYLRELCEDSANSVCGGIISMDLQQPDAVARWREAGLFHRWVKGVRHVLHVPGQPPGSCLTPVFISNVIALGDAGLCFEACVRNEELGDVTGIARQTPRTDMVLNHMGNVDAERLRHDANYSRRWRRNLQSLAACDNVFCKVSGVITPPKADINLVRPAVDIALNTFSRDKVVFASNFPVCDLGTGMTPWIDVMIDITHEFGVDYQARLFSANAARLYRLS